MSLVNTSALREIAMVEYADIVGGVLLPGPNEVRIFLKDRSFVDVWFSLKLVGRYSYYWERQALDGRVYRHDNAPHQRWQFVRTFPAHFHNGSEDQVVESDLSPIPENALRQFLTFVRDQIAALSENSQT
jgi:hypothetical protein